MHYDSKRLVYLQINSSILDYLKEILLFQVEILEINLQELQQEFYNRQMAKERQLQSNEETK